ncbi:MAG: hypothetical protein ACXADU_02035 [Promethearchaeota archaeon]|jgi:hypothetical protein
MSKKDIREKLSFFNSAIEYFEVDSNSENLSDRESNEKREIANFLRNSMIDELDNLKSILESNPNLKIASLSPTERKKFQKFIKFYSYCPLCGNPNHYFNLQQLYFDRNKRELIKNLINFMRIKKDKFRYHNLHFGIPCCDCYNKMNKEC